MTNKFRWVEWLPLLEFAYNSHQSLSISYSPFFILLGFQPISTLEKIAESKELKGMGCNRETIKFLNELETHWENT